MWRGESIPGARLGRPGQRLGYSEGFTRSQELGDDLRQFQGSFGTNTMLTRGLWIGKRASSGKLTELLGSNRLPCPRKIPMNDLPIRIPTAQQNSAVSPALMGRIVREILGSGTCMGNDEARLEQPVPHIRAGRPDPLQPALTTAAWPILFRDAHLINVGTVHMPYPFFVLCGMMLWAAFLESMDAPSSGVRISTLMLPGRSRSSQPSGLSPHRLSLPPQRAVGRPS